uniref:Uncharacterized protein n=1 Tax=Fibrocapsa japonica TaxID=94617 RepID=A0A7S2V698_9STRA
MLDAEGTNSLGTRVAPRLSASPTPSMLGTPPRPAHCHGRTAFHYTSLPTSMGTAKVLVTCNFLAASMFTRPFSTVPAAVGCTTLSILVTSVDLALLTGILVLFLQTFSGQFTPGIATCRPSR